MKRGSIYWADLGLNFGSEQAGKRPVLIIQNDVGNRHSQTVICASLTSICHKKANLPTHIKVSVKGFGNDSIVLLEQLRTVDKSRLGKKLGELDAETMEKVDEALSISVGLCKVWGCKNGMEE